MTLRGGEGDELVVVTTTAPDDDVAAALARALVERSVAACVQCGGVRSTYRWDGAVEVASEVLVTAKTVRSRVADVEAVLAEIHPYQLPELVVIPAGASDAYGAWVREGSVGTAG